MGRTTVGGAWTRFLVVGASLAILAAGCGSGGSVTTSASPTSSGARAANVVQAAPVQHVALGDLSVGYRIIGPLAAQPSAGGSPAAGGQPPLLMIMGSGSTMDEWSPALVSALAQDRQVVLFDNRGMGETTDPAGAYPFTQLADDTAGLITALGHQRMDVMGWSIGGSVAIDLAARHPEVVGRLVSYAGDAGGRQAVMPSAEVIAALTDTSGTPQQRGERLLELLYPPEYRTAHPDYARTFPIPTERASTAAIGLQDAAIATWPGVGDALPGIVAPALFVTGTEDVISPPENALLLAQDVPGSWLARFPGAGHGLMYQDPQGLADTVLTFLRVTSPESSAGG